MATNAGYQCGTCQEWIAFGTTHAPICEHYTDAQDSDPNAAIEARGGE